MLRLEVKLSTSFQAKSCYTENLIKQSRYQAKSLSSKIIGSKLCMSSTAHPESDGQTERFNSMLEEYLRHFATAKQTNWTQLLDTCQLCFNSQKSSSTNKSPFEVVTGQQPLLPHTVDILDNVSRPTKAESFSLEWKQNIDIARSYLEKAVKRMKKNVDHNRRPLEFQVGGKVLVKLPDQRHSRYLRRRGSKLLQRYIGPMSVLKRYRKGGI